MPPLRSLLWFRKGLRLHDNPALLAAVDGAEQFCAVFCLDPWFIHPDRVGANRLSFLLESLAGALLCSARARPLTTDAFYVVLRCLPGLLGQNMRSCWLRAGQQKERVTSHMFDVAVVHAACTLLCTLLVSPVTQGGSRGAELAQACADLHSSLQARGSRLLVLRGQPEEELPRVWRAWGVSRLCFEVDTEEYARTRDRRVCALAAEAGAPPHKLCCRVCCPPLHSGVPFRGHFRAALLCRVLPKGVCKCCTYGGIWHAPQRARRCWGWRSALPCL